MTRLYIRGLVKIAGDVRKRLQRGIAEEEERSFTEALASTLAQVDQVCQRYQVPPEQLPAPTRNAYNYLRSLDLANLPRPRRQASSPEHDQLLQASFERVNREYYSGQLSQPVLRWSQRVTRREFGSYRIETDVVTLSRTLSSAAVPDYVRDSVMYHELLHRQMGAKRVNGRLRSHTPAFREAEKRFREYEQAQNFLKQLAAELQRKHRAKPGRRTGK